MFQDESGSEFTNHEPCPECASTDNLARYTDGHAYCFGCGYYEHADGSSTNLTNHQQQERKPMTTDLLDPGDVLGLNKRGITRETCQTFGYTVGEMGGKTVQIAPYRSEGGQVVAQKVRFANKDFTIRGSLSDALPLFGQHLWRDGGRKVVITEGEIDALSVSQMQGNRWPVVSVPSGAQGATKSVQRALDWLLRFDEVIILFDDDEPGRDAAQKCAALLPPGKGKIATIPGYKDANEALVAGDGDKIIQAVWGAKEWRPDGIVWMDEAFEDALKPVEIGLPWWLQSLTDATFGRRSGELYGFGAGTGVGKTDFITQQAAYDVAVLGEKIAMIYLEMPKVELTRRLAGKVAEKIFHIPGEDGVDTDAMREAFEKLSGKVAVYDHFGETDWAVIKQRIQYVARVEGIKIVYLDHLTAMADPSDERASLETIMKEMAGLAQELGLIIHFVSHLATPDGKPHEEGGRVMIRHFKGSRAIGFWSYFMFGLERDQQSDKDEKRLTTVFRILKDRYTGRSTGETFALRYNAETGMLYETFDFDFEDEETASPF